jgi:hypothetical protein
MFLYHQNYPTTKLMTGVFCFHGSDLLLEEMGNRRSQNLGRKCACIDWRTKGYDEVHLFWCDSILYDTLHVCRKQCHNLH